MLNSTLKCRSSKKEWVNMLYKFIRPLILALVALGLLNTPHMIGLAQDDGLSRQEQAALREILAAYERTRNWNT